MVRLPLPLLLLPLSLLLLLLLLLPMSVVVVRVLWRRLGLGLLSSSNIMSNVSRLFIVSLSVPILVDDIIGKDKPRPSPPTGIGEPPPPSTSTLSAVPNNSVPPPSRSL